MYCMSLALYRKYRPQKFGDLIGQDSLVSVLQNSLKSDKLHHAYLFIGSRGTGKTSTARIMAKAINCTNFNKEKLEPCSECNICISIANGSYLDLIEIDAASNRGIDDIRDLRDKIKLAPTEGKFKVYIIDEVHMLTNEAFNALLKTGMGWRSRQPMPCLSCVLLILRSSPRRLFPDVSRWNSAGQL